MIHHCVVGHAGEAIPDHGAKQGGGVQQKAHGVGIRAADRLLILADRHQRESRICHHRQGGDERFDRALEAGFQAQCEDQKTQVDTQRRDQHAKGVKQVRGGFQQRQLQRRGHYRTAENHHGRKIQTMAAPEHADQGEGQQQREDER
ncbi:hypothetical protein D3C81_1131210 [compost metagenome]